MQWEKIAYYEPSIQIDLCSIKTIEAYLLYFFEILASDKHGSKWLHSINLGV